MRPTQLGEHVRTDFDETGHPGTTVLAAAASNAGGGHQGCEGPQPPVWAAMNPATLAAVVSSTEVYWSRLATTNIAGTVSCWTAARAWSGMWSRLVGSAWPDSSTTASTGGCTLVAAISAAEPPMDAPASATLVTPRWRSAATAATRSSTTRPAAAPWGQAERPKQRRSMAKARRPRLAR